MDSTLRGKPTTGNHSIRMFTRTDITALILSKLIAGKFIPLYYGSSFSYIAATLAITNADFGVYAADKVAIAQVGIVATGIVNIIVGLIIRFGGGRKAIDRFLPPVVTGSVAAVIGISLAFAALDMANAHWGVALITLTVTIVFSVYLQGKGFFGLIPIFFGLFPSTGVISCDDLNTIS